MTTQQPAPQQPAVNTITELKLTDDIKEAVNGALMANLPIVLAYVDEAGQPSLSFRGSTQVYADDKLAIWVRNPEGGLLKSLEKNPRVTLLYRNPETRANMQFRGRAHVDNADSVRKHVYSSSPQREQDADKDQKGLPLIIELDRVDGLVPGARLAMRRA